MSEPALVMVSIAEVWSQRDRVLAALDAEERRTFDRLHVTKRRRDWLAGRIAAKRAVQRRCGAPLSVIGIRALEHGRCAGRPFAVVDGREIGGLSIAHAGDLAVALTGDTAVGVDIETIEPRPQLEGLAFTDAERARWQHLGGAARDEAITVRWCEKEAFAKHAGVGLRASFRALDVPADVPVQSRIFEHGDCRMASAWLVC